MGKRYRAVIFKGRAMAVGVCLFALAGSMGAAGQTNDAGAGGGAKRGAVSVLDNGSVWRMFEVLKPPVVALDSGPKAITSQFAWLDEPTAGAPQGWTKPEFADATWLRGGATGGSHTPYLAELCARGRFEVSDPSAVKDLRVSVGFHGGAIVFINGKEIARANLPKGPLDASALADAYPTNVFVSDSDELVIDNWAYKGLKEALTGRERKVTDIAIPGELLHKGVNVLAIEVIRAPYDARVYDYWKRNAAKDHRELKDPACPYDLNWNTCELRDVELKADGTAGLAPNVSRPKGLQAWNSSLLHSDVSTDFGDPCEPLEPVLIEGPRNGWSSGKVVIGSAKAIEGLKVTWGDFKKTDGGGGGAETIPAAAMRARYAVAFGERMRADTPLEALLEEPLEKFPVAAGGGGAGAVVPIWLTVKIPAETAPGTYRGEASVQVEGEQAIAVPIRLKVAGFTEPDTEDYRTWMELMESPDTLAAEYHVPLWSEKHWDLMAQSMRYMGEIGSRVVHVPLIAETNSGNEQSMVRWIKKADGSYDYDFSVMDKYLDYAEKYEGKPKLVAFIAWEIYLNTPKQEVKVTEEDKKDSWRAMEKSWLEARWKLRGKGPAVTALDPVTGQLSTINLPRFEDPAAREVWKPLFDELHKRMAKRGLENTMLLGMASDVWPDKEEMETLEDVSGNLPWINQTHGGSHVGGKLDGIAPVAYTAYVWNCEYPLDPSKGRLYGWKRPELYAEYRRFGALNDWPLSSLLLFPEIEITGAQRGLGRIGADFWPVLKDKRGERRGWVWAQYPQSGWHSCNLMSHLLDPGPAGPVATSRYEAMREGVQECEARIAIEKVLTDPGLKAKLGDDLAARAQALLDARIPDELKAWDDLQLTGRTYATSLAIWHGYSNGGEAGHYWYSGSGWEERTQKLYEMAGEVTRKAAE